MLYFMIHFNFKFTEYISIYTNVFNALEVNIYIYMYIYTQLSQLQKLIKTELYKNINIIYSETHNNIQSIQATTKVYV